MCGKFTISGGYKSNVMPLLDSRNGTIIRRMYSVFLVDDEHIVLEGIRNKMDWENSQFTFAGEASDGELALSMIQEVKPDILITDIKMPFMDGLELSRILKKIQPWIRIIILSGHDEFEYAQRAISIGVEDYILKPFTHEELLKSLEKVAARIEKDRLYTQEVRSQNLLIRNKFLTELVFGTQDAAQTMKQAQNLGLNFISRFYKVICTSLYSEQEPEYRTAGSVLQSLEKNRGDVFLFFSSPACLVSILLGNSEADLDEESYNVAQALNHLFEQKFSCVVVSAIGKTVEHVSNITASYKDATDILQSAEQNSQNRKSCILDSEILEKEKVQGKYAEVIAAAKDYIARNYASQDISLSSVAECVHLSPNHFSTIFSQEYGTTFIEYLTRVRIEAAKKLLRETDMKGSDIAFECGFNDPHYFSFIFKKTVGISPREYKSQ